MAKDGGVYIPRRLIFIMIFVSLCVNVFFLLMGVLLGKDDLQWEGDRPSPSVADNGGAQPGSDVLEDLAAFDEPEPEPRLDPLDARYLQNDPAPVKEVAKVTEDPVTKPAMTEAKEPSRPVAGVSAFWIQVLATADKPNAVAFQKRLATGGYAATLFSEGTLFKIRVGPFSSQSEAEKIKAVLDGNYKIKGWIIKK